MNNYPQWWDKTVTLYNQYKDPLTRIITWYRTVLTNCFWDNVNTRITIGDTEIQANNIVCRIPESPTFREKLEWKNIPADLKGNYFTLGKGDILIKGAVGDMIDENISGHRSNDIIAKYKEYSGCIIIDKFSINTGAGRALPHYHITGE